MEQNNNGNVNPGTPENTPKLIEVEVGGKKVMVSEDGKDLLMTQADYTRKTQALAEERKTLEDQIKNYGADVQTAKNLLGFLSEDSEAAEVMEALISKDRSKVKKIFEKEGGDNKIEMLEKEVANLANQIKAQNFNVSESAKRNLQMEEAKKILSSQGIDFEKNYDKMLKLGKENNNPYIPWAILAAKDELIERARAEGELIGKKKALEEEIRRIDNTPIITGGRGEGNSGGIKNTRDAAKSALNKLLQNKGL